MTLLPSRLLLLLLGCFPPPRLAVTCNMTTGCTWVDLGCVMSMIEDKFRKLDCRQKSIEGSLSVLLDPETLEGRRWGRRKRRP